MLSREGREGRKGISSNVFVATLVISAKLAKFAVKEVEVMDEKGAVPLIIPIVILSVILIPT